MSAKPGNFNPDIHVVDYRAEFEAFRTGHGELVSIDGRKAESLNGKWHFVADPLEYTLRGEWYKEARFDAQGREKPCDYDFEAMEKMSVPACRNMERPELFLYESMVSYFRTFKYKKREEGERLFLHFEGAAYRTYVFLNGECVALHDGASTPFSAEITGKVKEGQNRLLVAVDAKRMDSRVPMTNTDWFNYGGIYRDVLLVRTPKAFLKDWFVRLAPGSNYSEIAVDFAVDGADAGEALFCIEELGVKERIAYKGGKGSAVINSAPELWEPASPKLYDVSLSIEGDALADKIGFREFKTEGGKIFLNGKELFMKGICVHEDHIELGKATNESVIRETIRVVKEELHGVFIRLAHYPHTRLFSRIADEMGVMLWEEIPVYWAIAFASEATYQDAENQLAELIKRDKNRASVVIWSVGNENPDTDERFSFMSRLAAYAKSADPTRAVSAACLVDNAEEKINDRLAEKLDIIGINEYYGWYDPDFSRLGRVLKNSNPAKPVIVTETGADARAGNHGTRDMLWTEEFQEEFYGKQIEEIAACPFIKGLTPWILYDFRAQRRFNQYQEGFNRKGLIDADRKTKKLAFKVLSEFYRTR